MLEGKTFFHGYVHDVSVAQQNGCFYLKSKCWASQKKATKYEQKIVLSDGDRPSDVKVEFAACVGCPAGAEGGICQHVFALLMVAEHYGPSPTGTSPGEQSVTSGRPVWGPRERNVEPHAIMQNIIEKSKLDDERKRMAVACQTS